MAHDVIVEDLSGDTLVVEISALHSKNLDKLQVIPFVIFFANLIFIINSIGESSTIRTQYPKYEY